MSTSTVNWKDWLAGLSLDTIGGSEKIAVLDGVTAKNATIDLIADHAFAKMVGASTIVPTTGDTLIVERSGAKGRYTLAGLSSHVVASGWSAASTIDPALGTDVVLLQRSGTVFKAALSTIVAFANAGNLDLTVLTAGTPTGTDLFLYGAGSTPRKITLANLEAKLWADFATYVASLDEVTTTASNDVFFCIQGGLAKFVTPETLAEYVNPNQGDVIAPATTSEGYVPQWSSTANTLADGLVVMQSVRTVAGGAAHTALATELAVRNAIGDIESLNIDGATDIGAALVGTDLIIVDDGANGTNRKCAMSRVATYVGANLASVAVSALDIDGATDIGADLADADLIVVDDGANGTNRKSAMSRVWTYITSKIQGLTAKTTPIDADILLIQDSADSNALKELTVANLWDNRYAADMLSVADVSTATWVVDEDNMASDLATKVPTQQSVKAYVDSQVTGAVYDGDIADLNIDGATDIGADLADADLIIVDDGAGGTNRKSALSRVWTYVLAKIVAITDVSTHGWVVDEDTMSSNSATKVPTQQSVKAYVDNVAGVLNNFSGTADPVAGDDTADGYSVGSLWVNTSTDQAFVCVDNSAGAAVWVSMTQAAAGWDGDLTDINWATGSDVGADLADGDQIVIADDSDSDNPKRSAMSRVRTYVRKQQTASYAANQTLTAAECNGYVVYMTAAGTLTLPAIADGMSVTVITIGDVAVSIDPNAADKIWLDGTALDDGDKITNGSAAGDIAVLTYYSADGWHAATNGWTDGGA